MAGTEVCPGEAIVLGAGRCQEIPLGALVDRFRRVTLSDQNPALLEDAVTSRGLDIEQRMKIQTIVTDMTGVTADLLGRVAERLATAGELTPETAAEGIAALAEATEPGRFTDRAEIRPRRRLRRALPSPPRSRQRTIALFARSFPVRRPCCADPRRGSTRSTACRGGSRRRSARRSTSWSRRGKDLSLRYGPVSLPSSHSGRRMDLASRVPDNPHRTLERLPRRPLPDRARRVVALDHRAGESGRDGGEDLPYTGTGAFAAAGVGGIGKRMRMRMRIRIKIRIKIKIKIRTKMGIGRGGERDIHGGTIQTAHGACR